MFNIVQDRDILCYLRYLNKNNFDISLSIVNSLYKECSLEDKNID